MIQPKNKIQAFNMLQDTINYYYNHKERICYFEVMHSCLYNPPKDIRHLTAGCAIGRYLPKKLAKRLDVFEDNVSSDRIFNLLPEWMKDMGKDFLLSLQSLHDKTLDGGFINWQSSVINICKEFNFDYDLITWPKN